jgi:hypothetical protein
LLNQNFLFCELTTIATARMCLNSVSIAGSLRQSLCDVRNKCLSSTKLVMSTEVQTQTIFAAAQGTASKTTFSGQQNMEDVIVFLARSTTRTTNATCSTRSAYPVI